jgi:hypothetical protein
MRFTCTGLVKKSKDRVEASILNTVDLPSYLNSNERKQDLDFGVSSLIEKTIVIEFPSEHAVETQLPSIKVDTPNQSYAFNYTASGNTAVIQERRYVYRQLPKEEFSDLKNTYLAYNRVVEPIEASIEAVPTTIPRTSTSQTSPKESGQELEANNDILLLAASTVFLLLVILILFKGRIIKS